jgi:hypothetical protein
MINIHDGHSSAIFIIPVSLGSKMVGTMVHERISDRCSLLLDQEEKDDDQEEEEEEKLMK